MFETSDTFGEENPDTQPYTGDPDEVEIPTWLNDGMQIALGLNDD